MTDETTQALLPVTNEQHVKISAEEMEKGLCSMTCPQCLAIPSSNGLCPLCSDSGWVIRTVEEAAKMRVPLRWGQIDKRTERDTGDEAEDSFHLGVSDGFQEAVQIIDTLTGPPTLARYSISLSFPYWRNWLRRAVGRNAVKSYAQPMFAIIDLARRWYRRIHAVNNPPKGMCRWCGRRCPEAHPECDNCYDFNRW